ncbi:hypothetical protein F2Q68_00041177 [Brassica cretica]|uniref:Uncharacterized protein n=1 Tax=Brassica cretica TaxID=69181 RepID=A0A3N6PL42_BRACR|nr:hypothetical protein F2Q68_00041177 [Brassica cretica]
MRSGQDDPLPTVQSGTHINLRGAFLHERLKPLVFTGSFRSDPPSNNDSPPRVSYLTRLNWLPDLLLLCNSQRTTPRAI